MQSSAELLTAIYQIAVDKGYPDFLGGKIYKIERPINSVKEDMVLNVLAVADDNFSQGFANVNVYVPKVEINIDGTMTKLRDGERVDEVINKMRADFKQNFSSNYNIWTSSHNEFNEPTSTETFINFRLEFRIFI